MKRETMIAAGFTVLATLAAGGAWWYSLQDPKIGTPCVKSGEIVIARAGTPLSCQDGVRWKTVN